MKYLCLLLVGVTLVACGESPEEKIARERAEFVADSTRKADSLMVLLKPRKDIYDAAIGMVKERLKVPSSARFASIQLLDDTAKVAQTGDVAVASGWYEAQNPMGVFMPGSFKAHLKKVDGKWVPLYNSEFLDVDLYYNWKNPLKPLTEADAKAATAGIPLPPPPMDTSVN